jgi:hypothetical protein
VIKIAIDKVHWTQPVSAGRKNEFGKSLAASQDVKLWYLGHGVLVEAAGQPDKLVPVSSVLLVEASAKVTPEQWGGLIAAYKAGDHVPVTVEEQTQTVTIHAAAKRGPGRPPKAP